jgi:hypothetical protein
MAADDEMMKTRMTMRGCGQRNDGERTSTNDVARMRVMIDVTKRDDTENDEDNEDEDDRCGD